MRADSVYLIVAVIVVLVVAVIGMTCLLLRSLRASDQKAASRFDEIASSFNAVRSLCEAQEARIQIQEEAGRRSHEALAQATEIATEGRDIARRTVDRLQAVDKLTSLVTEQGNKLQELDRRHALDANRGAEQQNELLEVISGMKKDSETLAQSLTEATRVNSQRISDTADLAAETWEFARSAQECFAALDTIVTGIDTQLREVAKNARDSAVTTDRIKKASIDRQEVLVTSLHRIEGGLIANTGEFKTYQKTAAEHIGMITSCISDIKESGPPILQRSDLLVRVPFEQFLSPKHGNMKSVASANKSPWIYELLGPSGVVAEIFSAAKMPNELICVFSPEVQAKLASGAAHLMNSAGEARTIAVENGLIIGHGIVRAGKTAAQVAAAGWSCIVSAAYLIAAHDTRKQLRSINATLKHINEDSDRTRLAGLEADYESLRLIARAGIASDRPFLLDVIRSLQEQRAFMRYSISDTSQDVKKLGPVEWLRSKLGSEKPVAVRRETIDSLTPELARSVNVYRFQALGIAIANDENLSFGFIEAAEDEARRLRLMSTELTEVWGRLKGPGIETPPKLIECMGEVADLFDNACGSARRLVNV